MNLTFDQPVGGGPADEGPDPLFDIPGSVTPITFLIKTARDRVSDFGGRGYVDLRTMEENDPQPIAARIELIVTNQQNSYILQYRSTAWSENDPETWPTKLDDTDFLTVIRTSPTTWTIESGTSAKAHLSRRLGWNETHDVGIFDMPISLEIELQ
jgi:hypothetical protein